VNRRIDKGHSRQMSLSGIECGIPEQCLNHLFGTFFIAADQPQGKGGDLRPLVSYRIVKAAGAALASTVKSATGACFG
jgi:C4-dicarboxylate-specific signal transduction histidine kinase